MIHAVCTVQLYSVRSTRKYIEDGNEKYIQILKNNFPSNFSLKGMRIVLDCANGAGYKSAPKILSDLGAKVFSIGINPNGLNINTTNHIWCSIIFRCFIL